MVVLSALFACQAVRLARDAANEAIHKTAPWEAIKGSHIVPDSCWSHETLFNRPNQVRDGEGFPLHHNDASSRWESEFKSKVEPAATGAERKDVEGSGCGM
jgi:hypothetical protein